MLNISVTPPAARREYHRLPPMLWPEVVALARSTSLRKAAREYGISHEAVRQLVNQCL